MAEHLLVTPNGVELIVPTGKDLILTVSGGASIQLSGGSLVGADIEIGSPTVRSGADAPNLVIDPASRYVSLTKGSPGAYTLAAPGEANVGHRIIIMAGSAQAHVVTVTGLAGGNTLTYTAAIGICAELLAISATVWSLMATAGVTQSQVG